jgi:hypothetical protein
MMCENINVIRIENKSDILKVYREAYERTDGVSSLIIEKSDDYNL